MDAKTEQQSLAECPLPPEKIGAPLTLVWTIDREIAALQEQINALAEQRQNALDYAVKNNIAEEGAYRLDQKVRRVRTLDPARFREVFPDEYRMACDIERRDLEERTAHIGEKINLTLVDKLIKKPKLEAAQGVITIKESISYGVVPK